MARRPFASAASPASAEAHVGRGAPRSTFRGWGSRPEAQRLLAIGLVALSLGLLAAFQVVYLNRGFFPGDAFNYLGAAERLNAGHNLYAISPGDRPIGLQPPSYTVPFLYPPPIAVFWRPLALLGDLGAYLWWAAGIAALGVVLALFYWRRPVLTALAVILLVLPLTYELGVGNVNPLLIAGLVATWYLTGQRRDIAAGAIVAAMVAVKLTPVVLVWWLLVIGRPRAVVAAVVTGAIIVAVSLVGAGLNAHLRYLEIIGQMASAGSSEGSLAGIARTIGVGPDVARLLPGAVAILGIGITWVTRRQPRVAYVVAVLTMVLGSPVININWPSLFLALLAPAVWRFPALTGDRQASSQSTGLVPRAAEG